MGQRSLLLRRRIRRGGGDGPGDSSDGLMDILSNVVGVMALIGSLTGIFATSSALNIQAPMQQKSSRNFLLLQASKDGLWDLARMWRRVLLKPNRHFLMMWIDSDNQNYGSIRSGDGNRANRIWPTRERALNNCLKL